MTNATLTMNKTKSNHKRVLIAAAAATATGLIGNAHSAQAVVDGSLSPSEYLYTLATQTARTGFGNNANELNAAYANVYSDGSIGLMFTGNLDGNALNFFLDSRQFSGGVATVNMDGTGVLGSIGGQRTDDWGSDTDGSAGVFTPPGGGSVLSPSFNPDKSIEMNRPGASSTYYIDVIDITLANDPPGFGSDNRGIFLGSNALGSVSANQPYNRDGGANNAGDIEHAFDNSNVDGVNGQDVGTLGDPLSATKGYELVLSSKFLNQSRFHNVRIMPYITNNGGDYLSNQFLPGLPDGTNNLADVYSRGGPLFDSTDWSASQFLTIALPTHAGVSGNWSVDADWSTQHAPNGINAQAIIDASAGARVMTLTAPVTVGALGFVGNNAVTITGAAANTLQLDTWGDNAVISGSVAAHVIDASLFVNQPTDINMNGGGSLTINGTGNTQLSESINVNTGTLTIARTGGTSSDVNFWTTVTVASGATFNFGGTVNALSDGFDHANVTNNAVNGFNVSGGGTKDVSSIDGSGNTTVSGGTNLIANHVRQSNLTVNDTSSFHLRAGQGANGTSVLPALPTVAAGAQFDIGQSKLIVQFGTNASPLAAVRAAIIKGRGGTDFGTATWQGTGGIASDAAAPGGVGDGTNPGDGISFAVGYVENSFLPQLGVASFTTFGGQTVDAGSMLIRFTKGADATLDGKVNTDDVTIVGADLDNPGTGEWYLGDFDYDGICDTDDVTVLGAMYDATDPGIGRAQLTAQYGSAFADAFERGRAMGAAAVPEPTSLTLLGLGGAVMLRRRRRR